MSRKNLLSGRRKPVQSRSAETKLVILEASLQLLLRQPAQFTTIHIARRAGVSVGSVYQYFRDKESIAFEVAKWSQSRLLSRYEQIVRKASRLKYRTGSIQLVEALLDYLPENEAIENAVTPQLNEYRVNLRSNDVAGKMGEIIGHFLSIHFPHAPINLVRDVGIDIYLSVAAISTGLWQLNIPKKHILKRAVRIAAGCVHVALDKQ